MKQGFSKNNLKITALFLIMTVGVIGTILIQTDLAFSSLNHTQNSQIVDSIEHSNIKTTLLSLAATLHFSITASKSSGAIDVGQTVVFSTALTGSTYSYTWSGLPTGCSDSTASSDTCTPTGSGSFSLILVISDTSGNFGSATLSYTVNSDPSIQAPTTTSTNSIDLNQPVIFSVTQATGGTGTNTYSWSGLPSPCTAGTNVSSISCTPSSVGSSTIHVTVTDSNGGTGSNSSIFSVYSDPTVGVLTTNISNYLYLGQSVKFTSATPVNGLAPYFYTWNNLPSGCTNSGINIVNCKPTASGSSSVSVTVKDSNSYSITSPTFSFIVYNDLTLATPTSNSSSGSIDLTQSVKFSSAPPLGGLSPYSYTWTGLPTGCTDSGSSSVSCTPSVTGNFNISVTVTDTNNVQVTSSKLNFIIYNDPIVSTPTANVTSGGIDIGQVVSFTVSANNGYGLYSYSWLGLPTGCVSKNSISITCIPTGSGVFNIKTIVTDSNNYQVTSSILNYQVQSATGISNIIPSIASGNIDVGQSVTFTVTPSGGSGYYTYSWSGLPTGCVSANASSISCIPTGSGSFTISVSVIDSNGVNAISGALIYLILSSPFINSFISNTTNIDLNQGISFIISVQNGNTSYSYSWNLPIGCFSSNTNSISCKPNGAGSFTVNVTVTDGNGYILQSSNLGLIVNTDPTIGTPTASKPSGGVDSGQNVTFTSTLPSGGRNPYSYSWSGLPTGCLNSDSSSIVCTPTASGTFNVIVTITDSNGYKATSPTLTFQILGQLSVSSFIYTQSQIDLTQNSTFSVSINGGSSPFTYSWKLPTGCTPLNQSYLTCIPTVKGSYTVNVTISDKNGYAAISPNLVLTVYSDPSVSSPIASVASGGVDVSQSVTFIVTTPSGGLGPYTYLWNGLPTGCTDSGSTSVSCSPTASGTFNVKMTIVDVNGFKISSTILSYKVLDKPTFNSFSSSRSSLDLTQNVTLSANINYGKSPYSYDWKLPTGCSSTNTSQINCVPTTIGLYVVNVTVTDDNGYVINSNNIQISVYSTLTVNGIFASKSSGTIDVGQNVTFSSASPSNGLSPYTYFWTNLPGGCSNSGKLTNLCLPTSSGTYNITIIITDSNGFSIQQTILNFIIYSLPAVTTPTSSTNNGTVGQVVTFTTVGSGGTGFYTYSWNTSSSDLNCVISSSNSISCTPLSAGSFRITVTIKDSNGGKNSATLSNFQVNTESTSSSTTSTTSTQSSNNSSSVPSQSTTSSSKGLPGFTSLLTILGILFMGWVVYFKQRNKNN